MRSHGGLPGRAASTLAFDHSAPGWLVWDGAVWSADNVALVTERVRHFIEAERRLAIDPRALAAMGRVRFMSSVEQVSRSDPLLAVHQGMLDVDPLAAWHARWSD